jgi:hypothetical protein
MSSASDRATTKTRRTEGGMTIRIKVCIARGDLSAPNCLFCEMNWTNCCANTDERRWSPSALGPGDEGASDAAATDTMVSSAVFVDGLWLLLCGFGGVMCRCCVVPQCACSRPVVPYCLSLVRLCLFPFCCCNTKKMFLCFHTVAHQVLDLELPASSVFLLRVYFQQPNANTLG